MDPMGYIVLSVYIVSTPTSAQVHYICRYLFWVNILEISNLYKYIWFILDNRVNTWVH